MSKIVLILYFYLLSSILLFWIFYNLVIYDIINSYFLNRSIIMNRLENLNLHLTANKISGKNPDDVVICSAVRTPLTKAKKGGLKDTSP